MNVIINLKEGGQVRKTIFWVIFSILIFTLIGCEQENNTKLPIINLADIKKIQVQGTASQSYKVLNNKRLINALISNYNKSKISADQSFETTPDYQIKVTLKNGDNFLMMDGDGPRALIKLPNGSKKVVNGSLGPFIERFLSFDNNSSNPINYKPTKIIVLDNNKIIEINKESFEFVRLWFELSKSLEENLSYPVMAVSKLTIKEAEQSSIQFYFPKGTNGKIEYLEKKIQPKKNNYTIKVVSRFNYPFYG